MNLEFIFEVSLNVYKLVLQRAAPPFVLAGIIVSGAGIDWETQNVH